MRKHDRVPPDAVAMTESLRAFGYDLSTALADIIDNSISAKAQSIQIYFHWNGPESWISITDDGEGMTSEALVNAMKLGSRDPRESRDKQDLGRFGLGLKTASFSQCRRLTVLSKASGHSRSIRCWDLDYLEEVGDWALIDGPYDEDSQSKFPEVRECGTVVLWEKLDRITSHHPPDNQDAHRNFLARIDEVKTHLAMVFHRFLSGKNAIKLFINENPIIPWNPFLEGHPATQQLHEESFSYGENGKVKVLPFVLPHQSKLTPEDHQQAGGSRGWNAHQGFYVYRNKRLLVPGGWMRLFRQEEHYKLARVQVDLPNNMDEYWKLDVRKAHAYPPDDLRPEMKRIATATRSNASKVYRHRGAITARRIAGKYSVLWLEKQARGKIFYRLNREHPLYKDAIQQDGYAIKPFLRLIEETVPIHAIIARFSEDTDHFQKPFEQDQKELEAYLNLYIRAFLTDGDSETEIVERLHKTEPFTDNLDYLAAKDLKALIKNIRNEREN